MTTAASVLLALDQGTTSSRAILFDAEGRRVATAQRELPQYFPQPGWVEHDPEEIWQTQLGCAREALAQSLGLQVSPLTPRYAQQLGVAADSGGLVILGIDPNSDSGQKGLQRGDIVVTANYRPVNTVADLEGIVSQAKAANRESVLLRIQRRGRPLTYVPIRLR